MSAHRSQMSDSDVEQNTRSLSSLDDTLFTRHHLKAILVAGVGFLADQYDLFIINLVIPMIGYVYFADNKNTIPSTPKSVLTASVSFGAILGQVFFGFLADKFGRKRMYGLELMIIIVGTVASSISGQSPFFDVVFTLSLWRFIQGIGIGGDYPMSATIAAEFANVRNRGAIMASVFSMQGFGLVFGVLVALIVLPCFKEAIDANVVAFDHVWRIIIILGLLPAFAALYYRLTIPESPRFTRDVNGDHEKARKDASVFLRKDQQNEEISESESTLETTRCPANKAFSHGWVEFKSFFGQWKNLKLLIGTSGSWVGLLVVCCWFCIDVALYGLGLNNSMILEAIGFSKGSSPYDSMLKIVLGNLIISLLGNFPGYFVAVATIDRIGRRKMQLIGFGALTTLYIIIASAYHQILETSVALFIVLYTFAQFFINFGPNVTTFIIPGEAFPTQWRATAHGISAAWGKVGACIASYGFTPVTDAIGVDGTLGVMAAIMFVGWIITYFLIPETMGTALESIKEKADKDTDEKACP